MTAGQLTEVIDLISSIEDLVHVVLSGRRRNFSVEHERLDIRPVEIKGSLHYQISYSDGRKVTTKNIPHSGLDIGALLESGYSNITVRHRNGELSARFTKKDELLISHQQGTFHQDLQHDRAKARLLHGSDPFLKYVGISDSAGTIKPSKMSKYKQIEEFLRLVTPEIVKMQGPVTVVDLGAGSGYLTFAIHQYLHQQGMKATVIGVDIRPEFETKNRKIAQALGIESTLHFHTASIDEEPLMKADVVIALHACDTATDSALAWAVKSGAQAIFVAPCCQHDIQRQMKTSPEPWSAITSHGILKERLGDLLTDALRIEILKSEGYRCDAVEFIGGEHTPRNVMIRAILTGKKSDLVRAHQLSAEWGVKPALIEALANR